MRTPSRRSEPAAERSMYATDAVPSRIAMHSGDTPGSGSGDTALPPPAGGAGMGTPRLPETPAMPQAPVPLVAGAQAPAVSRRVSLDLAAVTAVTLGTFVLSAALELREWLTEVTHPLERYQMDELPLTFAALALSLAWFSWRRWRNAEDELKLRVAAQQALLEREEQFRLLSQTYVSVQEEERRSLARELHDELGQCLNAIKLDAVAIRDMSHGYRPEVEASANAIVELSGHVYDAVRGIMQRLRPAPLDALGLHDAVAHLVGQWQRRNPTVQYRFAASGDLSGLGEVTNITVYRVVQECLTNIARHAGAKHVSVILDRHDAKALHVMVADDGRGLDLQAKRTGLGLLGVRERIEALGGRLQLIGEPGSGLEVRAIVPVESGG